MQGTDQDGIMIYFLEDRFLQDVDPPNLLTVMKDHMTHGRRKFIFSFTKIKDLFSPVVGILAVAARRAKDSGAEIKLAGLNPFVEKSIRASRLDRFFEIYTTVNEARESFKKSPVG